MAYGSVKRVDVLGHAFINCILVIAFQKNSDVILSVDCLPDQQHYQTHVMYRQTVPERSGFRHCRGI